MVVFLLGNTHHFESGRRGHDRTSDPDAELTFCRRKDLRLSQLESLQLSLEALIEVSEKSVATGEDYVAVEIRSNVHVAHHDGRLAHLVQTVGVLAQNRGFKERL